MTVAKYEVLRKMKFNGRNFERGDAIDRAYIVGVAPEKEGTLLRTRFIGLPAEVADLTKMLKADLVAHARKLDLKVDPNWRKTDLIDAIEGA
jgi:hypothetical protein